MPGHDHDLQRPTPAVTCAVDPAHPRQAGVEARLGSGSGYGHTSARRVGRRRTSFSADSIQQRQILRGIVEFHNRRYRAAGHRDLTMAVTDSGRILSGPRSARSVQTIQDLDGATIVSWTGPGRRGAGAAQDGIRGWEILRNGKRIGRVSAGVHQFRDPTGSKATSYAVRAIGTHGTRSAHQAVASPQAARAAAAANQAARAAATAQQQAAARTTSSKQAAAGQQTTARGAQPNVPAAATATAATEPPTIRGLQPTKNFGFTLHWQPVAGAVRYGVWQDGRLLGTVPSPSFSAQVGTGNAAILEIDAEFADGRRGPRSPLVAIRRGATGAEGAIRSTAAAQPPAAQQAGSAQPAPAAQSPTSVLAATPVS